VTAQTRRERPGARPRRKPHRKYGYSDFNTKGDVAWVVLAIITFVAVYVVAAVAGPVV
jgi:hypothetical protein